MDGDETAAMAARPEPRRLARINSVWLTALLPIVVSVVSLALSLYTVIEANREPEIWLSAPDVVRVAKGGGQAWFYAQPRLVSAAANDRVAVITALRLEVTAPEGGDTATFTWDEQGTWQYDTVSRGLTWIYLADPAPLVVSPSSPQLPICLFIGPTGWSWQAGTYRASIIAGRGHEADALQTAFAITLSQETVNGLNSQPHTWFEALTSPA